MEEETNSWIRRVKFSHTIYHRVDSSWLSSYPMWRLGSFPVTCRSDHDLGFGSKSGLITVDGESGSDQTDLEEHEKIIAGKSVNGDFHVMETSDSVSSSIKMIRLPEDDENGEMSARLEKQFHREVTLLSCLYHRNVIKLIGGCRNSPVFCIITEYLYDGSLRAFLYKLEYLKPENILFDQDFHLKVADFGIACEELLCDSLAESPGTYRWMAPEMIIHNSYGRKVDVYSFGLLLWEMVAGTVPYDDMTPIQAAFVVVNKNLRPAIPLNCPLSLDHKKGLFQWIQKFSPLNPDGSSLPLPKVAFSLLDLYEPAFSLLDLCKAEKVPGSGVTTNHSTSPFAEDIYEKFKDFLIEYEAVAIVERAVIKALKKQYSDILTPLKDSIPKKLGFHVQKLTRRQSTTLYSIPNQLRIFLNTIERVLDVLHCRVEDIFKPWASCVPLTEDKKLIFGEQLNGITVLLRTKYKNYMQATVEKLGRMLLASFFEHSILVVAFKFAQNHSQVETSLAEVENKRIDAFLVDPWHSNLG
ncbi:hypothetical protein GIB67_040404 [Kingdonia uniflora]|uniref:Protein kinase domain-containing protein n=1 Tax=Kingdonia uniflora TaxID=39325 RepID=A0A7J7KXL5_9MAGN|nr:hypothetical protein GIB67_040404 [Kingdonia uniflora]